MIIIMEAMALPLSEDEIRPIMNPWQSMLFLNEKSSGNWNKSQMVSKRPKISKFAKFSVFAKLPIGPLESIGSARSPWGIRL